MTVINEAEFDHLLSTFKRYAFRLETLDSYALDYEREDYERFLAGYPRQPAEADWWQPWLNQIAKLTREGKTVSRVRVLAEPPTDYQRWMIWAAPWHIEAGEQIAYMNASRAVNIGLPLDADWWLLDDERVIIMTFTDAGEIDRKTLLTNPVTVAPFIAWRDLAVRNATTAERFAAA